MKLPCVICGMIGYHVSKRADLIILQKKKMPVKNNVELHSITANRCRENNCRHTDAQRCMATKYGVSIEWLNRYEKCECPCHPDKVELAYEDQLVNCDEAI